MGGRILEWVSCPHVLISKGNQKVNQNTLSNVLMMFVRPFDQL